jgi:hypothetical protein
VAPSRDPAQPNKEESSIGELLSPLFAIRAPLVSDPVRWPAYAAATWTFAHAGLSLNWFLGGDLGVDQLGVRLQEEAASRQASFLVQLWAAVLIKVLAGLLALALVRPWGRRVPRRLLLVGTWGAGIGLGLYGIAGMVQAGLAQAGVIGVPPSMGEDAAIWYLSLWEPLWLIGGMLFLLAAGAYQRGPINASTG